MTEREFAENTPATDSTLLSLVEERILTGIQTRYIYLLGLGQEARSGIHYALLLSLIQVHITRTLASADEESCVM
jgi:hypothetical protein